MGEGPSRRASKPFSKSFRRRRCWRRTHGGNNSGGGRRVSEAEEGPRWVCSGIGSISALSCQVGAATARHAGTGLAPPGRRTWAGAAVPCLRQPPRDGEYSSTAAGTRAGVETSVLDFDKRGVGGLEARAPECGVTVTGGRGGSPGRWRTGRVTGAYWPGVRRASMQCPHPAKPGGANGQPESHISRDNCLT